MMLKYVTGRVKLSKGDENFDGKFKFKIVGTYVKMFKFPNRNIETRKNFSNMVDAKNGHQFKKSTIIQK